MFSLRSVPALLVVFVLSAVFVFTGCDTDDDTDYGDQLNVDLIGTWEDTSWGSEWGMSDGYEITSTKLNYFSKSGETVTISYGGTIRYVKNFTSTAGVIIIEYDADKKPTYYIYDEGWNITGTHPLNGNFIGIYYEDFKVDTSVEMATALKLADYSGAEEPSLDAAKKAFTSGNRGDYIGDTGVYSLQK